MAVIKLQQVTGCFNGIGYSETITQDGSAIFKHFLVNGEHSVLIGDLPGYTISGSADVNGDGISDVLLDGYNTTVAWIMSDSGPVDWRGMTWNPDTRITFGGLLREGMSDAALLLDPTAGYAAAAFADGSTTYITGWDKSHNTFKSIADINGDGISDIILQTDTNALLVGYLDANFSVTSWGIPGYVPDGYEIFSTVSNGFNDDIILLDSNTGTLIRWGIANGAAVSWNVYGSSWDVDVVIPPPQAAPVVLKDGFAYNAGNAFYVGCGVLYTGLNAGEKVVAAGDFSRTGHEMLLTQNTYDGMISIRCGQSVNVLGNLGTYEACFAADYNGDGRDDVIIYDKTAGVYAAWIMGETSPVDWMTIDYIPTRNIVGFGNADNYGGEDAYVVDRSGYVAIASQSGQYYVGGFDASSYRVVGIGDFNNDKISDIAFAHRDGSAYVWLMDGFRQVVGGMSINIQEYDKYICGVVESSNGADLLLFDTADGEYSVAQLDHGTFTTVSSYDWESHSYRKLTDFVAADFGNGAGLVSLDLDTNAIVMQQSGAADVTYGYIYSPQWTIVGADTGKLLLRFTDGGAAFWNAADGSMQWMGGPQGYDIVGFANVGGSAEKDIILHNEASGEFCGWIMGGGTPVDWKWITSSVGAEFVDCEDFNGDGVEDLWISFDKSLYAIDSNSRGILSAYSMPEETEFLDMADVNGDCHADLILRHCSAQSNEDTGFLSYVDIWNNSGIIDVVDLEHNRYRAAMDIDGDNKDELLLHDEGNNSVLTYNI